jgi:hypothetical protein
VFEILPAAHALTECDTTSSFFGIGKKSMFKALKETTNQFVLFETKAHLCFSFLENNVHKGQELLGISQQCNLECYSLDTVGQNTVHAKLCVYPPLLVCMQKV